MKTTESDSKYDHLEKMKTRELLKGMKKEDRGVPKAIKKIIPFIFPVFATLKN